MTETMRILAVDDRNEDLYLLNKLLEGKGFDVVQARNGKEALDIIKETPPDLVISDILMPEMDGYQLLKEVKSSEEFRNIPFVFYTATYTTKKDEEFAYSLGASRFIVKPQEPEAFADLIDKTVKDQGKGILTSVESEFKDEKVYLKEYNERLINKLEDMVTKLEAARDDLKGSRDFLESILNSIRDGIIFIDQEGMVTLKNQMGSELEKEVRSRIMPEIEDHGDCDCTFDIPYNERFYDASCSPVLSKKGGKYLGTSIVLRDITERRNVQEELEVRVEELEKWQRLTVGREIKMIELKKKVKELEKEVSKRRKK